MGALGHTTSDHAQASGHVLRNPAATIRQPKEKAMSRRKSALGRLGDGTPLTEDLAERLADEAEHGYELAQGRRVGRPSLGGRAGSSPRVNFRISDGLHERALQRASREGKTVSQLAREALEDYVK